MPRIGTFTLLNIAMPLRTTPSDASCGVVTMTPPSSGTVWQSESCASPVPGGRSTSRKSVSPHSTANRNCLIVVAIQQADPRAELRQRAGQVDRTGGFADAALAAGDGNDALHAWNLVLVRQR